MLGCGVTAPGCAAALKCGPPLEWLPGPDPPPCTAPLAWAPPAPPPPWPPPPPPPPPGLPRAAIEMPSRSAARIGRIRHRSGDRQGLEKTTPAPDARPDKERQAP